MNSMILNPFSFILNAEEICPLSEISFILNVEPLNPKNFVSNVEEFSKFKCITCMENSLNMVQCKNCQNYFCYKCAVRHKSKHNKCPQNCTAQTLQLQPIHEMKIQYRCPFSEKCTIVLKTIKQFWEHEKECEYINEVQKKEQQKKWQFLCKNGHVLEIVLEPFEVMSTKVDCSGCGNKAIVRATCRKCDLFYCNTCRPFPIFDNKCPIGHSFETIQNYSSDLLCDVCSLPTQVLNVKGHKDFFCNFDICDSCYQNFPKFQSPVDYVCNHKNYCDLVGKESIISKLSQDQLQKFKQQHQLQILHDRVEQTCNWCSKTKLCYKMCKECQKYYCFSCKPFQIMDNFECQLGHQLSIINPLNQQHNDKEEHKQEKGQQKKMEDCFGCGKKFKQIENHPKYVLDYQCRVALCSACCKKQIKRNQINFRIHSLSVDKCENNHYLYFLPYSYDKIAVCHKCNEKQIVKFSCFDCKQCKNYCSKCVAPKSNKVCYCSKELKKIHNRFWNKCLQCRNFVDKPFGCEPCAYSICQNCFENGYQSSEKSLSLSNHEESSKQQQKQQN